jgi:phosphoglycolate phosphatase-like HAD superfamily hydrolase/uridine kinase
MPRTPFLFDAVVFDLDGTLVATDRFWVDAARAGAKKAFSELGIEHAMPSSEQWMSLVGHPLSHGFDLLFADLTARERELIRKRCEEEEQNALRAGRAALLPGVAESLGALRERGVKLGIASNCGQDYLDVMMNELGLARWIGEARCLDTPGASSKAWMVGDLVERFGTRSAVMVGDRLGDRDAAWENGLPHVHLARGFAQPGEIVACEATIDDMSELVPRLERRTGWIEGALTKLGLLGKGSRAGAAEGQRIGITGHTGSGKTLFARDCTRVLAEHGRKAAIVALDEFPKSGITSDELTSTGFWSVDKPLDHLERAYDVDDLIARVIEPHQLGKDVRFERNGTRIEVARDAVLVLQGVFLLHPRLRPALDKVVHLEVTEGMSLRRIAGRDARRRGPESLLAVRRHLLPTQRAFDEVLAPAANADLLLDAENALGP